MTRPPNCVPGIGFGTEPVARMTLPAWISSSPTRTLPSVGQRGLALDVVDLVLLEQPGDAAGERLDDLQRGARLTAPKSTRRLADCDAEVAGVADLGEDVGRAQHRLGRDARVVEAAAAHDVLLDDGGLHPQLRRADRGDVPAGAGPDDDAVVGALGHGGDYTTGGRSGRRSGIWSRASARTSFQNSQPPSDRRGGEHERLEHALGEHRRDRRQRDLDAEQRLEAEHRPVLRLPHPDRGDEQDDREHDARRRRVLVEAGAERGGDAVEDREHERDDRRDGDRAAGARRARAARAPRGCAGCAPRRAA